MNDYYMPPEGKQRIERLVGQIMAAPGDLIKTGEFDESASRLHVRQVVESLPEGMTEDDLVGVLRLALLTECATETYSNAITERARDYDAGWLEHFNEDLWKPDEMAHAEPFKLMLLDLGYSEAELDRQILETQQKQFEHVGGNSPVHVTTFGMVQEYLTDHYYGVIGKLLKHAAPEATRMTYRIKKRETLHQVWYRDMTAMQVEANPSLVASVSFELSKFRLPGNSLTPELQSHAEQWLTLMGADFNQVVRELVQITYRTLSSPKLLGRLALDMMEHKGRGFGPVTPSQIKQAMNCMGGWGYGLVGEAVLERAGLAFMYRAPAQRVAGVSAPARIRTMMRSWLAKQIPMSVITT